MPLSLLISYFTPSIAMLTVVFFVIPKISPTTYNVTALRRLRR
jgi:hypothetical protein